MKCSQCDKLAIRSMDGSPLCVEHWTMMANALQEQNRQAMADINHAEASMDALWGLAPQAPRYQVPPPSITHHNNTTVNHINISESIVGVLNTGTADRIQSSVVSIRQTDPNLADQVKQLVEKVSENTVLTLEARKEVTEQMEFLLSQLVAAPENRNQSVIKSVLASIGMKLALSADLITLWQALVPILIANLSL